MPLIKEKEFEPKTRLGVWKIEEAVHHLQELYVPVEKETVFARLKTERRQKEYLASRIALQRLSKEPILLHKDENGRPQDAAKKKHLSLSHADGWAAAIVSDKPVGVDIENYREKIFKVAHKFHSKNEALLFGNVDEIQALSLLWSAKESVFKRFSDLHLAFLEEMELVSDLKSSEGKLIMNIQKASFRETISIYYEMKKDYVLTWSY